MVNEFAEPSCPQWVKIAGFTNPNQQWFTSSWGVHTMRGGIILGDTTVLVSGLLLYVWKGF